MGIVKKAIKINSEDIGLSYSIEDISIQQSHQNHQTFEINLNIPVGQSFGVKELNEMLGEKAEISWSKDGTENRFIGFVDGASPYFVRGNRMLRLEGFSPTILMDAGPRFRVFSEMSLEDVVNKVVSNYKEIIVEIEAEGQVNFAVQCQESDFRFLNRLADKFGVNFFYDGEVLHFKDFKKVNEEWIQIEPRELHALEANINLAPLKFSVRAYNLKENTIVKGNASAKEYESNEELVKAATEKSNKYPEVQVGINYPIENNAQLNAVNRQLLTRQTNDMVVLRGRTSKVQLDIGSKINIQQKEEKMLPGVDASSPFLIITITHSISEDGQYQNSFTAIPSDYPFPLNVSTAKNPVCGPMTAIVKENEDPDNMGRVKVQFLMDENEMRTPWIRVLTTHTAFGGSFWLPEINETVVVFFEDFNPGNAAFVMGSMFNGELQPKDKHPKKRGFSFENIQLLFNDESGELAIKAKSIVLESEEEIIANASKITAKAKDGITLEGGKSIKQKATRIDLN